MLGNVHLKKINEAEEELGKLRSLYEILITNENKAAEAAQVEVQVKASEAWIEWANENYEEAKQLMRKAADMEDALEKHPVTPGSVLPARELLGEMLLGLKEYESAAEAFEQDLKINPNRSNGMEGLAIAKKMFSN